jgi:hypothetical protein
MKITSSHTVRTTDRPDITSTHGHILRADGSTLEARVEERGTDPETPIWYRVDKTAPWTLDVDEDLFALDGIAHARVADAMLDAFRGRRTVILM